MRTNIMKQKLRSGEPVTGVFNNLQAPSVIEVLALLGLDFAIMDAEHTALSAETAEDLYRAAELRGMSTVTRIGENSQQVIQKFMDSGTQGVLIPMVNTAEEAQRVVDSVKYPPIGKRGLAAPRSSDYGLGDPIADYVHSANQETLVAVQIETLQAVDNFDEIAAVDHVDVLFFGPSDLSSVMGYPGQTQHPDVLELIERLGKKTVGLGKAAATIARDVEAYSYWRDRGFQWLATGTSALLGRGVRALLTEIEEYEKGRS